MPEVTEVLLTHSSGDLMRMVCMDPNLPKATLRASSISPGDFFLSVSHRTYTVQSYMDTHVNSHV